MAKKKSKPADKKQHRVKIGPRPDKLIYFSRQVREFQSKVSQLKRKLRAEKSPKKRIELSVSIHQWEINLYKARIKLFNWLLAHGAEAGFGSNEAKLKKAISKQQDLITKARQAIAEADQRRKLKIRKDKK
jgi:hypothetical protein